MTLSPRRAAVRAAFSASIPVMWGYLAIGMTFGCMLYLQTGLNWGTAMFMSLTMYAGAMQYMAVSLIAQGVGFGQIALMTLLVNARHMVYGLSLFDKVNATGKWKPYVIFGLTDEAYALLVGVNPPPEAHAATFTTALVGMCQCYWIIGGVIGNVLASLFTFNPAGIDFSLTALFLVILHGQCKQYRTKLPILLGIASGLLALLLFGPEHMLLFSVIILLVLLIALRRVIAPKLEVPSGDGAEEGGAAT